MDYNEQPLRIRTPPPDYDDDGNEIKRDRQLQVQKRQCWQITFTSIAVTVGIVSTQVYLGYTMESQEVQIIFAASVLIYIMCILFLLVPVYSKRLQTLEYEV
jgi:hypothetical protein